MLRNRSGIEPYVTKDDSKIREIFQASSSPQVSLAEAVVEPGKETALHCHILSQEIYYILEGRGWMTLGDESFKVKKNDAILISPGVGHKVKNDGKDGLRILCICTPPYTHEDTRLMNE